MSYVTMSGTVRFKTISGPGIPGAFVVSNPVGSPNTATTDGNGHYTMQVLANTPLSITADHVTCQWKNVEITSPPNNFYQDFVLQPDA